VIWLPWRMFYQANLTPWALFTLGTDRFEVRFSAFHLLSDGSRPPIGNGHDTITNLISVIQQVDRHKTTRPALIRGVNVSPGQQPSTHRLGMLPSRWGCAGWTARRSALGQPNEQAIVTWVFVSAVQPVTLPDS